MKIGIDAKWYFAGPPSGHMVIKNIVDQILTLKDDNQYILFLDKKFRDKKNVFSNKNITTVFIWAGNNLLSNLFILPIFAELYKVDIVVYQNFSSFFGKHKKISYIHDILFLSHPHFYTLIEKIYFSPLKFLANISDTIITVSETEKKRLTEYGFKKNIYSVYHGVNQMFKPRDNYEKIFLDEIRNTFSLPERYILYVGRLNTRKNILNVIKAISRLKNDIKLVIVGKEDWKIFNFNKIINDLKIKNKIIFTGFVFGEKLAAIYALSEIFIFPSYAESFGLPPLEAMASGIPVVVSNATCIPEICGNVGYYVDPDDFIIMSSIIDDILDKKNKEAILVKIRSGVERSKSFTWESSIKKIIQICETTIKK